MGCSLENFGHFLAFSIHITPNTGKDVGAECRHNMQPSVLLPSVLGADSKLISLRKRRDLFTRTMLHFLRFQRPMTLTFDPLN